MSHFVTAYTTWGGAGTPSDPTYPIPPKPHKKEDIERWVVLQFSPLYVRFYISHGTTTTPPATGGTTTPPATGGAGTLPQLIRDAQVAPDAHIQEYKFDWNPITGHNHDGTTKGGRRISWRNLVDIPQILKDIETGTVGPGSGSGSIKGPYVSTLNGASGDVTVTRESLGAAAETIGLPTDGEFPGTAGLQAADKIPDALEKVDRILSLLAPQRPTNLSDIPLVLVDGYSARQALSGQLRANVVANATPVVRAASAFGDGERGTLTALVNNLASGSRMLSATGADLGTFASLVITSKTDPYAGQFGKAGFYKQLNAQILPIAPLALGGAGHSFRMAHSSTGITSPLTVFIDDPMTPVLSNLVLTASGSRKVSGVPALGSGSFLVASFTVRNAVSEFYNATRIGSIASSLFGTINAPLPASAPVKNAVVNITGLQAAIPTNTYQETATVTFAGYNSAGTQAASAMTVNMRVDSRSSESNRLKSGQGRFPVKGSLAGYFGDPFEPNELLSAVGNEELQMIGGVIQYPPAINYSNNLPVAGPNYSSLAPGSYQNMRWYTVALGTVLDVTSITLDILGSVGFGTVPTVSSFALMVKIDGSNSTGWLDANAAYPGVGNPVNNGDPALVYGSSTATRKVVTFGTQVRTGTVYVRIGIPQGAPKTFTGIARV